IVRLLDQEAEERRMMPLEQLAERIERAFAHGEHQLVIGTLFGGGIHGGASGRFNHGRTWLNMDFCEYGGHGSSGTCWCCPEEPPAVGKVTENPPRRGS